MKTLNIDEKTRIAIEDDNVIIQNSRTNKETGEISWHSKSYYRDLGDCATELLETLPTRSSELTEDLKSVVSAIKEAEDKILNAISQK